MAVFCCDREVTTRHEPRVLPQLHQQAEESRKLREREARLDMDLRKSYSALEIAELKVAVCDKYVEEYRVCHRARPAPALAVCSRHTIPHVTPSACINRRLDMQASRSHSTRATGVGAASCLAVTIVCFQVFYSLRKCFIGPWTAGNMHPARSPCNGIIFETKLIKSNTAAAGRHAIICIFYCSVHPDEESKS
jgi:hypothetical protein